MAIRPSKFASAAAMAAALSMTATPAAAVELPVIAYGDAGAETVNAGELNHHRYRRYRHRNRGIGAGDVVAGVVVLGALAAILGSSRSRDRDRDRYEDRTPSRDRARYEDRRDDRRGDYESRGIERAVDMCIDQVDRGNNRVENVDNAQRNASGWNVSGSLDNGDRWTCLIDNDGRIRSVDVTQAGYSYGGDGTSAAARSSGEQHSADVYARARANTRTAADGAYTYQQGAATTQVRYDEPAIDDGPRPSYPGGPIEGEAYDEEALPEWEGDDGRYTTAQAPNFQQSGN